MEKGEIEPVEISLSDFVIDPKFQIRVKLDKGHVYKYFQVYSNGGKLPPITLARIDGVLFLVDGWHRVEAKKGTGARTIEAVIKDMTINEAKWFAASVNMTNGLPLKDKEIREAFNVFIATKRHIKPNKEYMSYREMAAEFKMKGHTTLRRWIQLDHPKLFKKLSGKDGYAGNPDPLRSYDSDLDFMEVASVGIQNVVNAYKGLKTPVNKGIIIAQLEQVLSSLKKDGDFQLPDF